MCNICEDEGLDTVLTVSTGGHLNDVAKYSLMTHNCILILFQNVPGKEDIDKLSFLEII